MSLFIIKIPFSVLYISNTPRGTSQGDYYYIKPEKTLYNDKLFSNT